MKIRLTKPKILFKTPLIILTVITLLDLILGTTIHDRELWMLYFNTNNDREDFTQTYKLNLYLISDVSYQLLSLLLKNLYLLQLIYSDLNVDFLHKKTIQLNVLLLIKQNVYKSDLLNGLLMSYLTNGNTLSFENFNVMTYSNINTSMKAILFTNKSVNKSYLINKINSRIEVPYNVYKFYNIINTTDSSYYVNKLYANSSCNIDSNTKIKIGVRLSGSTGDKQFNLIQLRLHLSQGQSLDNDTAVCDIVYNIDTNLYIIGKKNNANLQYLVLDYTLLLTLYKQILLTNIASVTGLKHLCVSFTDRPNDISYMNENYIASNLSKIEDSAVYISYLDVYNI